MSLQCNPTLQQYVYLLKSAFLTDSSDIHLPKPDKLQSPGDHVEQLATIDVPLQNGGTKTQEENPDPSESVCFSSSNFCDIIDISFKMINIMFAIQRCHKQIFTLLVKSII